MSYYTYCLLWAWLWTPDLIIGSSDWAGQVWTPGQQVPLPCTQEGRKVEERSKQTERAVAGWTTMKPILMLLLVLLDLAESQGVLHR